MKAMRYIFFLTLVVSMWGRSLYYYQDFSNPAMDATNYNGGGWRWNFRMARDMIAHDIYNDHGGGGGPDNTALVRRGPNLLEVYGRPNNGALWWNTWYIGDGAKFTPAGAGLGTINATPEEPFGFTVIRYTNSLDQRAYTGAGGSQKWVYMGVWIASDNGTSQPYERWEDFAYFFEKSALDGSDNVLPSTYGYFAGYENIVPFSSLLTDIDGNTVGTILNVTNTFQRTYDDRNETTYLNTPAYHFTGGNGYVNPVVRPLGIRVTHDGRKVSFYVNYNPLGTTPNLSNAWVKVGEKEVTWTTNLVAFLGTETCYWGSGHTETQFDHFLIRTVASNVMAQISPIRAMTNRSIPFKLTINVTTHPNDSGVQEIYVKKPVGYGAWNTAGVAVTNSQYGGLQNNGASPPASGRFQVKELPSGELYIRFWAQSKTSHNIVTNGTIDIYFTLTTPSTPNPAGDNFEVYVDSVKHTDTAQDSIFDAVNGLPYATTGRQKAREAFSESLRVQVYRAPEAYAKVEYTPVPLIVGTEESSFTVKLSTEGLPDIPPISAARIYVPDGFTVSNNGGGKTNIVSTALGVVPSYRNIWITNLNGSNFIWIWYTNLSGGGLPPGVSLDRISFTVNGTPSLAPGMVYSNFLWQVEVDSSALVSGALWKKAGTNAVYTSQLVRVALSNAQVAGFIDPSEVAIRPVYQSNAIRYTYTLKNEGKPGNVIYSVKIDIPGVYSNNSLSNVSLTPSGTWAYSNNALWVTYTTPLDSDQVSTIQFFAAFTNTNVKGSAEFAEFKLYADNGNSAGYVLQYENAPKTWRVTIAPPVPKAEHSILWLKDSQTTNSPLFTTAHVSNRFLHTLYNISSSGVDILSAQILFPTNLIASISNVSSGKATNVSLTTNSGWFVITLKYAANSVKSFYDDVAQSKDTIEIYLADRITLPTNFVVPMYVFKTPSPTNDIYSSNAATIGLFYQGSNKIYVEYPIPEAAQGILPGDIDVTTETNRMSFVLSNFGLVGNTLYRCTITIPTNISTNLRNFTLTNKSGTSLGTPSYNPLTGSVTMVFSSPVDGGQQAYLHFDMIDHVSDRDLLNVGFTVSVSNQRGWFTITNVADGYYGSINFRLPKPRGGIRVLPNVFYVNTNGPAVITQDMVITVTNSGFAGDKIQEVLLVIPSVLTNTVLWVHSSRLGFSSTNSGFFTLTPTNILITYSGTHVLTGGSSDQLRVTFVIQNRHLLPQLGEWEGLAYNGFVDYGTIPETRYFPLTNVWSVGERKVYGTAMGHALVNPTSLPRTMTNGSMTIILTNGIAQGMALRAVSIAIPEPFVVITNSLTVDGIPAARTISNNKIWVDFGENGMPAGARFALLFNWKKPILADPTNVSWRTEVYYLSNWQMVPQDALQMTEQTVTHVMPVLYATVSPTEVNKDLDNVAYTLVVSNGGEPGNRIPLIRLWIPETNGQKVITNMTAMSSSRGATLIWSNDQHLYLVYTNVGWLDPGQKDTITFTGWDNQTTATFEGQWKLYASGALWEPLTNRERENTGQLPGSLVLRFVVPPYNTTYAVPPNSLNTVKLTNVLTIELQNISSRSEDDITNVRVHLPWPLTNVVSVQSSKMSGYTVGMFTNEVRTNRIVVVNYSAGRMKPSSNDTLVLTLIDTLEQGETNVWIEIESRFSTSGNTFVSGILAPNSTNLVRFVMPLPEARILLAENEVYTTHRKVTLVWSISNSGERENTIKQVVLTVPQAFTNGLTVASILTNGWITNISVIGSSNIRLMLSNLLPNRVCEFKLVLSNILTNAQTVSNWRISLSNGYYETNMSFVVLVKDAPSAIVSPQTVYSTRSNHYVNVIVENNASGVSSLKKVKVTVPNFFTNIVSVTSSRVAVITQGGNTVTFDYAEPLLKGESDTLSFTLMDATNFISTNILWDVEVDNGNGWAKAKEKDVGSLLQTVKREIPQPSYSWITTWYVSGVIGKTNLAAVVVSNAGEEENGILTNEILLPEKMRSVIPGTVQVSYPGAAVSWVGNERIRVVYPAGGLLPGQTNLLTFQFTNLVEQPERVIVQMYAYNGAEMGAYSQQFIDFEAAQLDSEGYVENHQILYSIDHDAVIRYVVRNGSYNRPIKKLLLNFDNEKLHVLNIRSANLQRSLAYTTNSTNLLIDYENDAIPDQNGQDTVEIFVTYTNIVNWTNDMSSWVWYQGASVWAITKPSVGETNILPVLLADFGRVKGVILPGFANPSIKLYKKGTSVLAQDKFGADLVVGADLSGAYTLDFVMPGEYDIGFIGKNYIEIRKTGITVVSNIVTNIGTNKMEHDLLSPDATGEQTVVCLDDMETAITFPSGTIGENFRLDIWITNMTPEQQAATEQKPIQVPLDKANAKAWIFVIRNAKGEEQPEQWLKNDATITIAYDPAYISAQGWSEEKLSVYYWRATTKQWVKLGGVVDRNAHTIKVKVSYLHKYYTVMADSAEKVKEGFISVRVDPKVFTPRRGGREVQNMKLSIVFEQPVEKYVVKIYDLKGNLVYKVERSGEFASGEVYWDGKDLSGYDVAGGVYVYKIEAGGHVYSGTIVIAR
ncbi:FlgD immunoglobulin-like domain containing protein [Thermospira aquatica]|uniref:FlgD/Vpr Ig-like domain-containing protein n=1 Tax=Thermospira aquatica TaxID=2828656 RepID=A0AAX3BE36_9SPIR|nr:FlgD immunoglobulin-like domain containing protein [Thermospira aquatica]URA10564.1 hypothetical protein KDW03_01815 [Thermospira aquatica]